MDVAVLKIEATDLAALPWGDSDKVHVGEQVFAIGNPFNLEDSASKGIVSATGRNLPDESPHYENFIQTDAAINPGNSGGALINIHGELIGINTAIASTSRGNMGVGFAIPSNLVRYAVEGLLKEGKLVRGYLGVRFAESVDDGVSEVFNLGTAQGVLVAGVQPGSPANKAGLQVEDFITEVDGHKIGDAADLRLVVSQLPIGKEVLINFIRGGASQSAKVTIAEIPKDVLADENADNTPPEQPPAPPSPQADVVNVLSGIQVDDLNDQSRKKFGVDPLITRGVVVGDVQVDSAANAKDIEKGDVIESASVNRGSTRQLSTTKDFTDVAQNLKPDQSVVLLVHRGKAPRFVFLAPGN
jgi:serine protease Do